jgi:hypothetical protein
MPGDTMTTSPDVVTRLQAAVKRARAIQLGITDAQGRNLVWVACDDIEALVAVVEAAQAVVGAEAKRVLIAPSASQAPLWAEHDHEHFGTGPRVELEPIWSCMGCGQSTNHFVTGSLVHPEDGLCATCVDAIRRTPDAAEPLRAALDILDVIDGIVDDTHPEGDGCPLCTALDDLRVALGDDR